VFSAAKAFRGDKMTEKTPEHIHLCTCATCHQAPQGASAQLHAGTNRVGAALDEKHRRRFVGLWAAPLGYGGVQHLARVTGLSRTTILRGRQEIEQLDHATAGRVRRAGGGRKRVEKNGRSW
jgi:hypothetical protein